MVKRNNAAYENTKRIKILLKEVFKEIVRISIESKKWQTKYEQKCASCLRNCRHQNTSAKKGFKLIDFKNEIHTKDKYSDDEDSECEIISNKPALEIPETMPVEHEEVFHNYNETYLTDDSADKSVSDVSSFHLSTSSSTHHKDLSNIPENINAFRNIIESKTFKDNYEKSQKTKIYSSKTKNMKKSFSETSTCHDILKDFIDSSPQRSITTQKTLTPHKYQVMTTKTESILEGFFKSHNDSADRDTPLRPDDLEETYCPLQSGRQAQLADISAVNKIDKKLSKNYPYVEKVLKKHDRMNLNAYTCEQCEKWFGGLGEEEKKERMKHCRHRTRFKAPPSTPEGFWTIGLPNTQQCHILNDENRNEKDQGDVKNFRRKNSYKKLF